MESSKGPDVALIPFGSALSFGAASAAGAGVPAMTEDGAVVVVVGVSAGAVDVVVGAVVVDEGSRSMFFASLTAAGSEIC